MQTKLISLDKLSPSSQKFKRFRHQEIVRWLNVSSCDAAHLPHTLLNSECHFKTFSFNDGGTPEMQIQSRDQASDQIELKELMKVCLLVPMRVFGCGCGSSMENKSLRLNLVEFVAGVIIIKKKSFSVPFKTIYRCFNVCNFF